MTTAVIPVRRQLVDISPRAWEHPADRAALATMQAIPGFDEALKKIVGMFGERGIRLAFQANAVRVSERQFPRLHRLWRNVHGTLDSAEDYELFVAQSPFVNAGAYGVDKPWVVLNSASLAMLSDREVEFIMGHELGHVLSGHALYHTMLVILVQLALAGGALGGIVLLPIIYGLREWQRKSELSADRAGLLAVQIPDAGMRTMMRLAGGGSDEEMDLGEFLRQADEYRQGEGIMDQVLKVLNTLNQSHPFLVLRAALLRDWIQEGAYDRIVSGEYPRRGDAQPAWSEQFAAGLRHYTGGAGGAAEKAGEAARKIRDAFDRGFRGSASPPTS